MAQIFTANVYRINESNVTVQRLGFPSAGVILRPAPANTRAGSVDLYGIVELRKQGLQVLQADQYYVVESVTALAALANA